MEKLVYLDNNATTQLDPRVLEAIMPFLTTQYANAASTHYPGISINQHVKHARSAIADLIGANPAELVFTSGATEAINLAIKGLAEANASKKHIITVSTEHPAVLDTCKHLEQAGYDVTYLPVQQDGIIDLQLLKQNIRINTLLVSVMLVNNETGVIQPVRKIAEAAHTKGAYFMTDATQAVGKIAIDVNEIGIDLMSFSAHKFYGSKGIGALYVRNQVKVIEQIHGGRHERGLRSGTLNVQGIIGLAEAARIAKLEMQADEERISVLRNFLETECLKIEGTSLNGNTLERLYNVSNICFKGIEADDIIAHLKNVAVSNGSACTAAIVEPSHVLKAMGLSDADAFSSVRFSLGRYNTKEEIEYTLKELKSIVKRLKPSGLI